MSDASDSNGKVADKKRQWSRGVHSTPLKRVRQFSDTMEVHGDTMWCKFCSCEVNHLEKSTAVRHLKSAGHLKMVTRSPKLVIHPGLSAPIQSAPSVVAEPAVEGIVD